MQVFKEFIVYHWYFAVPMFIMSLIAFALVLWRFLLNRSVSTNVSVFLPQLQDKLAKEGLEGAIHFCKTQPGLIPRKLCVAGLETSRQGLAAMRRAMVNVVELEILPMLNFLLPMILAIAKIATMVGLLGTVISMIGTFSELTTMSGSEGKQIGSRGRDIGLALFATALGLVTAIPLVFAHVLFKAWNHNFEIQMKSVAQKLLLMVQAAKTPAPAASSSAAPTPATMRR